MINLPTAFVAFVIGFGFLVFIHELGHFLVAKWVGIRCTQFALGFGPAMVSWRKGLGLRFGSTEPDYYARAAARLKEKGIDPETAEQEQALAAADELGLSETEYRLNYLPLGGYVKMMGQEDLDATAQSSDPRAFNSKSVGARFAVISAGVIMNLITGLVFFVIAFMAGVEFPPAVVGGVVPDMPAATTFAVGHDNDPAYRGLRVGDRVTHLDGDPVTDMIGIRLASALGAAGEPIELTIQRDGEPQPLTYHITPVVDPGSQNLQSLGILPPQSTTVGAVQTQSEIHDAGVRQGMEVISVDGEPVRTHADYYHALASRRGLPATVAFRDPDTNEQVSVELAAIPRLPTQEKVSHVAGLLPATQVMSIVEDSPAEAAGIVAGDVIAELDDEPWPTAERIPEIVKAAEGRAVHVVVLRDGKLESVGAVAPRRNLLGIGLGYVEQPIISGALPGSAGAALNLPGGSTLKAIAGEPVQTWGDAVRVLASHADDASDEAATTVTIAYELNLGDRPVEEAELTLTPEMLAALTDTAWLPPLSVLFEILQEPVAANTPWQATVLGVEKTQQFVMQAYIMILRLTQGTVEVEHLRGPAGILYEGTQITRGGWSYLFYFLGLLSVNLAVINFLPIPIADGGHAVFLIIEKIKGSPVSPQIQMAAVYVGLLLIGGLFLLVTYNDIWRMFE